MIESGDLAGIVGMVVVMAVPLVAILTTHQRKMAMIIHGSQREQAASNNDALVSEIRDLKQIVYQQAIALDGLSSKIDKVASADVQNRLTGTQG